MMQTENARRIPKILGPPIVDVWPRILELIVFFYSISENSYGTKLKSYKPTLSSPRNRLNHCEYEFRSLVPLPILEFQIPLV